ncbi:MAG TPA: outer membrane protein transport protein [Verrucomicrobiae bacterium]|nr:outer membrane protein transport protein [Verrucomicrobiae bacterium]
MQSNSWITSTFGRFSGILERRNPLFFTSLTVAGLAAISSLHVAAEGFRNPPAGDFGLGRAGGKFAQVDDVTAVAHNPANLVYLPEASFSLEPTLVYIHVDYTSPTGVKSETKDPWKLLPSFFASTPLLGGKMAAGIAVTSPYGLSNEWKQDGAFLGPTGNLRYAAPYYTELKTINFAPTVSVKLGEKVSLGAGFDAMWSELTFRQYYPWFLFGGAYDGYAKARGDGTGIGANVGLTWNLTDRQRLAATYRSPISVTYDGSLEIDSVPPAASALGASSRVAYKTEINFPTIVGIGYGIQLSDTVRLEVDGEWLQFSNFDSLRLNIGQDAFLLPSTTIQENWKNTFTAGIGGDWAFAKNWSLRASYQYYQSPVPNSTMSTTIPDGNQEVFTVGLAWTHNRHSLSASYGGIFYDDRHITGNVNNAAFNGDYNITVHLFSFGYRFRFL